MDDTEWYVTQKVYEHFAGPDAPAPTVEDIAFVQGSLLYQRWLLAERVNELGHAVRDGLPRPLRRLYDRIAT